MKRWVLIFSGLLAAATAAAEELATIRGPQAGTAEVHGFRLERAQTVTVEATGVAASEDGDKVMAAWILDASTRRVVWRMGEHTPRRRRRDLAEYRDTVRLQPGVYEAHYVIDPSTKWLLEGEQGWFAGVARSVTRFLGMEESSWKSEDLRLEVRGVGKPVSRQELRQRRRSLRQDAVLSLPAPRRDFCDSGGFALSEATELDIYAIGELGPDEGYDYAWITEAETGRTVWTLTFADSEWAGGARKNRMTRKALRLPAGTYAAHVVTDGSHSPDSWNALPPFDPSFWGLTIWVADPAQAAHAATTQVQLLPDERVIVEITRVHDDAHVERGFSLAAPADVRVYAVGEGDSGEMVDFGWIARAPGHELVWSMELKRTRHAGGSKKNRVADEIIHLEPGDYVVGFTTDDSHAYGAWNATPPSHPERWGITLLGLGKDFGRGMVGDYNEHSDPSILARIERVSDSSHERSCFSLDRPARALVYALGEGLGDELFDYGWIEDARTRRVVWSMRSVETRRAGGAPKNRLVRTIVHLPAGEYCAHYTTDDSHAYGDWNAEPPDDPSAWGIRVTRLEDRS